MKSIDWRNHTLLAASLAIVLMAVGCGREETNASAGATSGASKGVTRVAASQTGGPREEAVGGIALTSATPEAPAAEAGSGEGESTESPTYEGSAASQAASEPPDVVASIADSVAVPGAVVTVVATGSPDVVSMTLADGIGKTKALAYDSSAGVWTTTYRVPLRASSERVGFSITARNAHQQWRRVWLFPAARPAEVASTPDSAE
ncbi:MAG TPA: hypothetical protein VFS09_06635 [Candidatus Eisenbacteria bacterium]|nr:hypothetical protein [Candidatus Eisenbacteria bacterium]